MPGSDYHDHPRQLNRMPKLKSLENGTQVLYLLSTLTGVNAFELFNSIWTSSLISWPIQKKIADTMGTT